METSAQPTLSMRDVVSTLVQRIQRAGLLPGADVTRWSEEALPHALAPLLTSALRPGWRHICEAEPIVSIPAAVVVPCDLSVVFKCIYDGRWYDFELVPPQIEIEQKPYYLRGIHVFHRDNRDLADRWVIARGGRNLSLLECVQVLLQTGERFPNSWGQCSTGSLTTRDAGIPCEGTSGPLRLTVGLDHAWVSARSLRRADPSVPWPYSDYHHHIAVCEETIDPLGSKAARLGTLCCLPKA